jgi:hypothetical protein
LERLFYHNVNQNRMRDAIVAVIERYGEPTISPLKDRLWVTFASGREAQSLFVLDATGAARELAGVIVYTRENDELAVLFAAVRPEYAQGGEKSDRRIMLRMFEEVRGVARRVKGLASISIYARHAEPLRFSLK